MNQGTKPKFIRTLVNCANNRHYTSKRAHNRKSWYYAAWHCLRVNVLPNNHLLLLFSLF